MPRGPFGGDELSDVALMNAIVAPRSAASTIDVRESGSLVGEPAAHAFLFARTIGGIWLGAHVPDHSVVAKNSSMSASERSSHLRRLAFVRSFDWTSSRMAVDEATRCPVP